MTDILDYFPEGVAQGEAFINREDERDYLIKRIKSNKHCVLIAPRRYGKTSLVMKVSKEMEIPHCAIDLLAAYSAEYVRDQIITKVGQLVFELLPPVKKATSKLINIFQHMKPEVTLSAFGQKLSLRLSNQPLQDITDVLLKLDETAKFFKKRAVIFIDEFQQISQLKNHASLEAAIRHAVERSGNISYIFSGSNRHLLQQMFGDQGRPLYRLCQTITLNRMTEDVYSKQLQKLADIKWGELLSDTVLERIFICTEFHPFYMNVLCQMIWEQDVIVTAATVDELWHDYVKSQRSIISHDVTTLSVNQRKIITALAASPVKEIQAAKFTTSLKISASSEQQSVEKLLKNDLVYQDSDGLFHVLDPAMRYYLDIIL